MNIIILYEHLVREWDASIRLKELLTQKGNSVFIFSIIFERIDAYKIAKKRIPDIIIMPWFNDQDHERIVSPFIKINEKVRIINIHQEEIGSIVSERLILPKSNFAKNGVYHFVWGEYFKNKLINTGVDERRIYITGSIRNDYKHINAVTKKQLSNEYNLNYDKKWILFAENRGWMLNRDNPRTREMFEKRGISNEEFSRRVYEEKENIKAFFDNVELLDETFWKEYELIYRPHPGSILKISHPKNMHIIGGRSIYDWISNCELFLTNESTSIFEADMMSKPCAIVPSKIPPKDEDKMQGVWDYPKILDLRKINSDVMDSLKESTYLNNRIYKRYFGEVDGKAVNRTVAAINEIASNMESDAQNLECDKISYREYIRQSLFEKITFLSTKLRILDLIKFPRSAYAEKRDIPYSNENSWIEIRDLYFMD